ncbi:MAG: ComF family protein, partial [Proteobacteria bacterium]|nr:ComF family protein [Pseudomonadota bacterium]
RLAVHRFKYSGRTEMAGPLAAFMANRLGPPYYPPGADLVLPVPLHRRRLRQRGFNQALLLARALYRPWPALVCQDLLVRTRWTEPQVRLKGAERARNVSRAFAVADESRIRGKAVILLDDVYTTGATAGECARTLKRAGATRVLVLTLARVA